MAKNDYILPVIITIFILSLMYMAGHSMREIIGVAPILLMGSCFGTMLALNAINIKNRNKDN